MNTPTCAIGTLSPYVPSNQNPWNEMRIKHLYRRLGFGAPRAAIASALDKAPADLVDELIDQALDTPLSTPPTWFDWTYETYDGDEDQINQDINSWIREWMADMMTQDVRGKFILFWHNHFVTQLETHYFPAYVYHYHRLLQSMALGNFKDFVYEMGKNSAMLLFLNGIESTKYEPNENYARELYELFTMGRDNGYSQKDIEETARALTGWNGMQDWGAQIHFVEEFFDTEEKTIFGKTGNWNYDDVHEILFTERKDQIAQFICQKIYTAFVHPQADEAIIEQLAETFKTNNWEIAPVLRQLFKSEHFFDQANIGTLVKSPYDMFYAFFREVDFPVETQEQFEGLHYFTGMLGQELATPIDVAGWQGNRSWVDTARLSGRWRTLSWMVYEVMDKAPEKLSQLAFDLTGDYNTNDPALVTQKVVDYFLPASLHTPEIYERATEVFKVEIPQNYFDEGSWNLWWDTIPWQMTALIQYIIRIPEFQLS